MDRDARIRNSLAGIDAAAAPLLQFLDSSPRPTFLQYLQWAIESRQPLPPRSRGGSDVQHRADQSPFELPLAPQASEVRLERSNATKPQLPRSNTDRLVFETLRDIFSADSLPSDDLDNFDTVPAGNVDSLPDPPLHPSTSMPVTSLPAPSHTPLTPQPASSSAPLTNRSSGEQRRASQYAPPPNLAALQARFTNLSLSAIKAYWSLFCKVDADGDGQATEEELEAALHAKDLDALFVQLMYMYQLAEGRPLSFPEFLQLAVEADAKNAPPPPSRLDVESLSAMPSGQLLKAFLKRVKKKLLW